MLQVQHASRTLVRTPSAFFPAPRGKLFLPILRMEELSVNSGLQNGYNNWFFFHWCCSFSIQSILENELIPGGKESDEERQTIFFTPLNPLGGDSDEEEPRQFLKKCTITVIENVMGVPKMW